MNLSFKDAVLEGLELVVIVHCTDVGKHQHNV